MPFYYNGELIGGPRGPAGPDGNPIGTVISFMGTSAPKDYLACDGSEHSISDYPKLAAFFAEQFGQANRFGGNGTTTFAVPDLRNLFLRGFHGEAEEQLSGEIGEKQEATGHVMLYCSDGGLYGYFTSYPENKDTEYGTRSSAVKGASVGGTAGVESTHFTARPVNMAVLYCIKAVDSVSAEDVYSTEETRIGTWIDEKPIYRMVFNTVIPNNVNINASQALVDINIPVENMVNIYGTFFAGTQFNPFSCYIGTNDFIHVMYEASSNYHGLRIMGSPRFGGSKIIAIMEYTKTTD